MSEIIPQVQIRDDGSLEEVRELLDDLRIEYSVANKADDPPLPSHLLISSGPWAIETLREISQSCSHHFLHLVVIDRASRSLRAMLRRQGCDMVARRPVHSTVLRLILQRALYQGSERRLQQRVAIGGEIKIRSRLWSRAATLGELSRRGCGLITHHLYKVGDRFDVSFPDSLSGPKSLTLGGRVVGVRSDQPNEASGHATAVVFDKVSREVLRRLEQMMREHAVGSTGMLENAPGTPTKDFAPPMERQEAVATADPAERRSDPRGQYGRLVLARESSNVHSLIGRDLSIGGMRVGAAPELSVGRRLELIIYGHAGVLPVMVAAEVVRDDGKEGLGLSFDSIDGDSRKRLQKIVDSLEVFDSPTGTVVTEVVGTS